MNEYSINDQRIVEQEQYDGFYAVSTKLEDDAKSIVKIYTICLAYPDTLYVQNIDI